MTVTLVVDLHGGLGALGPLRPLFYRLSAEGRLAWFEASYAELPALASKMEAWLARHRADRFNIVPLVDVSANQREAEHACLVGQFARLRRGLLAPLVERGWPAGDVVIVALDGVDRNSATGEPKDAAARTAWHLDTRGVLGAAHTRSHLFESTELDSLDAAWGPPVILAGERTDEAVSELGEALRADIDERVRRLREAFAKLVDGKENSQSTFSADQRSLTPYLSEEVMRCVRQDFEGSLEQALELVSRLRSFRPSQVLGDILRRQLGLGQVTEHAVLLRIPWSAAARQNTQRNVDLVALLAMLAEQPELAGRLRTATGSILNFSADVDGGELASLFTRYASRLQTALDGLERPNEARDPLRLARLGDGHCDAQVAEPGSLEIERWPVPPWRAIGDADAWLNWIESTGHALSTREQDISDIAAKVRLVPADDRPHQDNIATIELPAEIDRRRRLHADAKRAADELRQTGDPIPFEKQIESDKRKVLSFLEIRPSASMVTVITLAGIAALAAAYGSGFAPPPPAAWSEAAMVPAVTAGLAIFAALAPVWGYRRKLTKLSRQSAEAASNVDKQLREGLRNHVERARALCRIRVAKRNLDAALSLDSKQARISEMEAFHREQLRGHLGDAMRIAGQQGRAAPDAAQVPDLDPTRPVDENRVYWPVLPAAVEQTIDIDIGTSRQNLPYGLAQAIRSIRFDPVSIDRFGASS